MNFLSLLFLGLFFLFFPNQVFAWDDLVVSVQAADKVTVLRRGIKEAVQLYGVQCPPAKSVAGKQAMEYTAAKALHKRAKIRPVQKKHLSPIEAVVFIGGHNLGASLIKAGWARVDKQQCTKSFCSQWLDFEQHARQRRVGIWRKQERK